MNTLRLENKITYTENSNLTDGFLDIYKLVMNALT